jgi:hypothetical protein
MTETQMLLLTASIYIAPHTPVWYGLGVGTAFLIAALVRQYS